MLLPGGVALGPLLWPRALVFDILSLFTVIVDVHSLLHRQSMLELPSGLVHVLIVCLTVRPTVSSFGSS